METLKTFEEQIEEGLGLKKLSKLRNSLKIVLDDVIVLMRDEILASAEPASAKAKLIRFESTLRIVDKLDIRNMEEFLSDCEITKYEIQLIKLLRYKGMLASSVADEKALRNFMKEHVSHIVECGLFNDKEALSDVDSLQLQCIRNILQNYYQALARGGHTEQFNLALEDKRVAHLVWHYRHPDIESLKFELKEPRVKECKKLSKAITNLLKAT